MSRSFILGAGAFCWTIAGAVAVGHLISGDVFVPVAMAAAAVAWVGIRFRRPETPAEADAAA